MEQVSSHRSMLVHILTVNIETVSLNPSDRRPGKTSLVYHGIFRALPTHSDGAIDLLHHLPSREYKGIMISALLLIHHINFTYHHP